MSDGAVCSVLQQINERGSSRTHRLVARSTSLLEHSKLEADRWSLLLPLTGPGAPPVVRYGYRSLDRQFLIGDPRVIDRPGPSLWATQSSRQLYLTSLLTGLLGDGPAATVTHLIPDLHHFRGSFGGRDTIPLWRDAACTKPNVTHGLLDTIAERLGRAVPPEDMLAYCYALLAAPSYTTRFREELEDPGPARAGHGRRRSLRAGARTRPRAHLAAHVRRALRAARSARRPRPAGAGALREDDSPAAGRLSGAPRLRRGAARAPRRRGDLRAGRARGALVLRLRTGRDRLMARLPDEGRRRAEALVAARRWPSARPCGRRRSRRSCSTVVGVRAHGRARPRPRRNPRRDRRGPHDPGRRAPQPTDDERRPPG